MGGRLYLIAAALILSIGVYSPSAIVQATAEVGH